MSAVEEIQAAIDKLTGLKAESTPGPWYWEEPSTERWPSSDQSLRGAVLPGETYSEVVLSGWGYDASGIDGSDADRELIVTLHRTIDAQLAILAFGIKRQHAVDWTRRIAGDKHVEAASIELSLARAINGGTK